jgi:hypothetical protein
MPTDGQQNTEGRSHSCEGVFSLVLLMCPLSRFSLLAPADVPRGGDVESAEGATRVRSRTGRRRAAARRRSISECHPYSRQQKHSHRSGAPSPASASPSTEEVSSLPTTPINGEWFIRHRRLTSPAVHNAIAIAIFLFLCCAAWLFAAFDPDVSATDAYFISTGELADGASLGSHFTLHSIFYGPACSLDASKLTFFYFEFAALMPLLVWSVWRLALFQRRMRRRSEERAQLPTERLLLYTLSDLTPKSAELNETSLVFRELLQVLGIVLVAWLIGVPIQLYQPSLQQLNVLLHFAGLHIVSILSPLRISYALPREYRDLIRRSRVRVSDSSSIAAPLAHQRPLYSLLHVLSTPHTYAALLAFLQQEYSSENGQHTRVGYRRAGDALAHSPVE